MFTDEPRRISEQSRRQSNCPNFSNIIGGIIQGNNTDDNDESHGTLLFDYFIAH